MWITYPTVSDGTPTHNSRALTDAEAANYVGVNMADLQEESANKPDQCDAKYKLWPLQAFSLWAKSKLLALLASAPTLGDVKMNWSLTAPSLWKACDGSAISRATYAALFASAPTQAAILAASSLNGAITNVSTAIVLVNWPAAWNVFGARPFEIKIGSEIMLLTAGFGTVNVTVTRACEGTAAAAHADTTSVDTPVQSTWGVGDGTTTFNVPDLRGRTPIGVGTGAGLTGRALAASGGEETHQLTVAELASHFHAVEQGDHSGSGVGPYSKEDDVDKTTGTATTHTGGDTPHNTMQPFLALNFIIYACV